MPLLRNCARSGQTAGSTPLFESFDVCVGEQQCMMRNVRLVALLKHEAQDVLDLRRAAAKTLEIKAGAMEFRQISGVVGEFMQM
jgi:hypothetical protein